MCKFYSRRRAKRFQLHWAVDSNSPETTNVVPYVIWFQDLHDTYLGGNLLNVIKGWLKESSDEKRSKGGWDHWFFLSYFSLLQYKWRNNPINEEHFEELQCISHMGLKVTTFICCLPWWFWLGNTPISFFVYIGHMIIMMPTLQILPSKLVLS